MQYKVLTPFVQPAPPPITDTPVDPPVVTPTKPPPVNTDIGTKVLHSIPAAFAVDMHPAAGQVLQSAVFVPEVNKWFSTQGMPGALPQFEDTMISRMNADGTLVDSMRLHNAGHGTSIGVEVVSGVTYIYLTYQADVNYVSSTEDIVRFPYAAGTFDRSAISGLTVMPKLDPGYNNIQFDWYNDFMVVRNSSGTKDYYIRRKISEWKVGTDIKYGEIYLQQAPPTLQGFCTMNGTLFRYIGASNGELLKPTDLTYIEQYSWATGARVDRVDYTALGKSALGTYPGGTHEPESCTMYRETDGTATLAFSVTFGVYPTHTWKMYKIPKIGETVTVFSGAASEANQNSTQAPT